MKKYPWNDLQKKKTKANINNFMDGLNKAIEVKKRQSDIVEKSSFVTLMKTKDDTKLSRDLVDLKKQLKEMFKNGLHSEAAKQIMSDWTDTFGVFKLIFTEENEFDFQYESGENYESDSIKLEFIKMYLPNSQYYQYFHKVRVCKNCNEVYFSSSKPDFCKKKCKEEFHKKKDITSQSNKIRMMKRK